MTKPPNYREDITVKIDLDVYGLLTKIAEQDRRTRKDEADFLIVEEARRRGLLKQQKVTVEVAAKQ